MELSDEALALIGAAFNEQIQFPGKVARLVVEIQDWARHERDRREAQK